ncbi:MAG TPA: 6-hydroxymethylpterin diphosphokinase MptE-like protein, partial [Tepidisphaeraceae bacterium]|nr:6-hydroxymethylpterin diphosphokinase MptE-like protein [Tepidisphaeraceae bacterium]
MSAISDQSLRFVVADDSPYLANLAALWAHDPKLASAIESLEGQPSHPVEPSKSGEPTVAIKNADGKSVYLHSRYQPLADAKRLIDPLSLDECVAFHVHGFGLGYHVAELFERASSEAMICIIEPDLLTLRTAIELRDFSKLIRSNRVMFFWQLDKAKLFNRLMQHSATVAMAFGAVNHPPSIQLAADFHRQMQTWCTEFIDFAKTNVSTLVINGRRTAENVTRNLPWYIATPNLSRLRDCHKGKPAVIVSAGPSLRKNKHLLPEIAGKAVIIAVQTTLQPLLEMGVEPQFVTSLDYHDICTRFFEKLPGELKTELVAEPKATNAIFDMHTGPLSLLGNDFAEHLLAEMKLGKAKLPSGATVAHLAYYVAEHCGCDPIIFIG